jgi:hypothetical protein
MLKYAGYDELAKEVAPRERQEGKGPKPMFSTYFPLSSKFCYSLCLLAASGFVPNSRSGCIGDLIIALR